MGLGSNALCAFLDVKDEVLGSCRSPRAREAGIVNFLSNPYFSKASEPIGSLRLSSAAQVRTPTARDTGDHDQPEDKKAKLGKALVCAHNQSPGRSWHDAKHCPARRQQRDDRRARFELLVHFTAEHFYVLSLEHTLQTLQNEATSRGEGLDGCI
jgi:hypothetical protein